MSKTAEIHYTESEILRRFNLTENGAGNLTEREKTLIRIGENIIDARNCEIALWKQDAERLAEALEDVSIMYQAILNEPALGHATKFEFNKMTAALQALSAHKELNI